MTNQSKQMDVRAQVDLDVEAGNGHLAEMLSAARLLTDNHESVRASVLPNNPKSMIAEFTIPRAREMDVVDQIMHKFAMFMDDYSDQCICFPKQPRQRRSRKAQQDGAPDS